MKIISCLVLLFCYVNTGFTQTAPVKQNIPGSQANSSSPGDDEEDPMEKKMYFMAGLDYLSNNVYLGRKDTIAVPYYTPYAGVHFKNGIYGKVSAAYTDAGGGHIDLTTLEAGWDHSWGNINGGINAERFFYNKNSLSVRANTKSCVGADAQYNNDIIEPQVVFDLNFNKSSTDKVLGLELDHNFSAVHNKVHIIPAIILNSGTQHYYDDFYINRLEKQDKTGTKKFNNVVADANEFQALDYEISLKTTCLVGKWLISFFPTYALPVNPANIVLSKKQHYQESLSNTFYLELDFCHR